MTKRKRSKNKLLLETEIELFCQSVEEILAKIKDRCVARESKQSKKENQLTEEEELLTFQK